MIKQSCKKPCPGCPWKKDSVPGYLGGNEIEAYSERMFTDSRLACHTRHPLKVSGLSSDIEAHEVCTGYVLARLNDCKSSKDPVLFELENNNRENEHRSNIFGFPVKINFEAHHGQGCEDYFQK